MVGTATMGSPVVSATALAVPVVEPPPTLSSASAPTSAAIARAASATATGTCGRTSANVATMRSATGVNSSRAFASSEAVAISSNRELPSRSTSPAKPLPSRAPAEDDPSGQRVVAELQHRRPPISVRLRDVVHTSPLRGICPIPICCLSHILWYGPAPTPVLRDGCRGAFGDPGRRTAAPDAAATDGAVVPPGTRARGPAADSASPRRRPDRRRPVPFDPRATAARRGRRARGVGPATGGRAQRAACARVRLGDRLGGVAATPGTLPGRSSRCGARRQRGDRGRRARGSSLAPHRPWAGAPAATDGCADPGPAAGLRSCASRAAGCGAARGARHAARRAGRPRSAGRSSNFWPRHPARGAGCNGTSSRRAGRPDSSRTCAMSNSSPRWWRWSVPASASRSCRHRCEPSAATRSRCCPLPGTCRWSKPHSFGVAMNRPRRPHGICCGLPFPPRSRTCLPPSSPPPAPDGTRCGGGASSRFATSGRQQPLEPDF